MKKERPKTKGLRRIRQRAADAWQLPPDIPLSKWCEENVYLSPVWEATTGRYDLANRPYWREPLDSMLDPFVRQISIKKSTQVGGTLLMIAAVLGISQLDPAPAMLVGPDEVYTSEVCERAYATADESNIGDLPEHRTRNKKKLDISGVNWYLAWAGSAQRLRGRACKRVLRSEIDVYPDETNKGGDPVKASSERVKSFPDWTIYDESSPDGDSSRIAEMYDAGHRAQWFCRCPKCGFWQPLRFFTFKDGPRAGNGGIAGIKDRNGNYLDVDVAVQKAHYRCYEGCKIRNAQKNDMVRGGKWVAEGQSITRGELVGTPTRGRQHLSYHLWSIHAPSISLGDLAGAYLSHRRDTALRDFHQNWLGLRYSMRKKLPEWHILGKRCEWEHKRNTIPPESWFVTAGVDVQLEGCWYVVRAWGDKGTSWLIDFGYLQRFEVEETDMENLSEDDLNRFFRSDIRNIESAVVNRWFPVYGGGTNARGQTRERPRMVGVDSQYRTREVHSFIATQDERRVIAVRGDHKTKPQDRWRETEVERPRRGGPKYVNARKVLNIFTPHYKEALLEKFNLPRNAPGAFLFYDGVVKSSSDYLRQLVNERPFDELDKRTGRVKTIWKPRSPQWGNHTGDCEVYAFGMAEYLLTKMRLDWDAAKWTADNKRGRSQHEPEVNSAVFRADQLM